MPGINLEIQQDRLGTFSYNAYKLVSSHKEITQI